MRADGSKGFCGMDSKMRLGGALLHKWEEPCISGEEGSGAVFFSGCSLKCTYCQNREISLENRGKETDVDELVDIFYRLEAEGANNIDLITAEHFIPGVALAIDKAKAAGFSLPFILNTGSYISVETLKCLEGLIDIYLPDMKYISSRTALSYSNAPDYPDVAKAAIDEMVRQLRYISRTENTDAAALNEKTENAETGASVRTEFDGRGLMKRGIIVRHMLLPGHVLEAKLIIRYLYETYGDEIYISMMNQYTPLPQVPPGYPELRRRVSDPEYRSLIEYAQELGVVNGFVQVGRTSDEDFIPDFEYASEKG